MKELRRQIAGINSQVHRRKEHRNATRTEKEILKKIEARISGKKTTTSALMIHREQLLDTLRYMKVKLEKMVIKVKRRVRNNTLFRPDERQFYRNINESKSRMGNVLDIDEFVESWGGIRESEKVIPIRPQMAVVTSRLKEKVVEVKV